MTIEPGIYFIDLLLFHRRLQHCLADVDGGAERIAAFFEDHGAVRLAYGRLNRLEVHRANGAKVNDVHADVLLRELKGFVSFSQRLQEIFGVPAFL